MSEAPDPRTAFIDSCVWHGPLDQAEAILAAHPEVAKADIYTASLLGDEAGVRAFIARDPSIATSTGGPRGWDPLTYLCFSKYLRLEEDRTAGFVAAATALLDAGANANTGFYEPDHQPKPQWESVLYGAAGVAHHPGITRLLLDRGADPNDGETPYHAPETSDNAALKVLVESGKLTDDSLATMLLRKADWHDLDGISFLLEHGTDPNRITTWGYTALHQAIRRDNGLANIEAMLDRGADPAILTRQDGRSAVAIAARRGRADVLGALARRSIPVKLEGVDRLIAACACNDEPEIRVIVRDHPELIDQLIAEGGTLLAEFAGTDNAEGIRRLLELGVKVDALYGGDGYFDIAPHSTALHVAAWRASHETVKLLVERGAAVDAVDGKGRTPLALAVRACVDSYWSHRRSPASVEVLLQAGASANGAGFPSGYAEIDRLV